MPDSEKNVYKNYHREQVRTQREQKYKREQMEIAQVISRKNNEALRSLGHSKSDSKPHKKILQITTQ